MCCDGLTGLGEEITATWPETTVQTCVVHLIRRSLNYASYGDRKAMAAGLRAVYTACDADAAYAVAGRLLRRPRWGRSTRPPLRSGKGHGTGSSRSWNTARRCGKSFTRQMRSSRFNREMRKVLKTRTQFPNDDSVAKTLWLAILDAEEKRAEQRARQAGKPKAQRDAVPRLIEGHVTQGWREAWGEMVARWPGRFADRA